MPYDVDVANCTRHILLGLSIADLTVIEECCETGTTKGLESIQSIQPLNKEVIEIFLQDRAGREVVAMEVIQELRKRKDASEIDREFAERMRKQAHQIYINRLHTILRGLSVEQLEGLSRYFSGQDCYDFERAIRELPIEDKDLLSYFFTLPDGALKFLSYIEEALEAEGTKTE